MRRRVLSLQNKVVGGFHIFGCKPGAVVKTTLVGLQVKAIVCWADHLPFGQGRNGVKSLIEVNQSFVEEAIDS